MGKLNTSLDLNRGMGITISLCFFCRPFAYLWVSERFRAARHTALPHDRGPQVRCRAEVKEGCGRGSRRVGGRWCSGHRGWGTGRRRRYRWWRRLRWLPGTILREVVTVLRYTNYSGYANPVANLYIFLPSCMKFTKLRNNAK